MYMQSQDNDIDLDEQTLMKIIAQWHPPPLASRQQYSRIQLIELQFKAIAKRMKQTDWDNLRRKVNFMQEGCFELMQRSQSFLCQVEKSLMNTERECSKRMERIEMNSLHRDIQIRSMLDDQILKIVEQNKILELGESQIKTFLDACSIIEEKIKQERKKQHDLMLNCRLQLEEFKFQNSRKIKEIKKQHEAKMKFLKQKQKEKEAFFTQKINQLKLKREAFESVLLDHIQKQILGSSK